MDMEQFEDGGGTSPATFADFVRSMTPRLLGLATLLTRDRSEAEDLAQDTMLLVHRKWSTVSAADDPAAYTKRMLVNQHLRNRRRRRLPTTDMPDFLGAQDSGAEAVDDRALLRQALGRLSVQQRTALVLRYYMDLDDGEIARWLGCRPATVRSHVHRGLEAIRPELRQSVEERP